MLLKIDFHWFFNGPFVLADYKLLVIGRFCSYNSKNKLYDELLKNDQIQAFNLLFTQLGQELDTTTENVLILSWMYMNM